MSKIGKNIRKIRFVKQLSQAGFAQIFNLARPSVGAYEEGRSEPKIDTVIQIAQYFGISVDSLLTKELTINDLYRFDSLKSQIRNEVPGSSKPVKQESGYPAMLVWLDRHPEYIHKYRSSDFIDSLPTFRFPWITSVNARAFEFEGESMSFEHHGILPGDLVICPHTVPASGPIKPGALYVLVTTDKILVRRFRSGDKRLNFACDHPDWPSEEYLPEDLLELWEVAAVYSRSLFTPVPLNDRIEELEKKWRNLAERLERLEHHNC